MHRIKGVFNTFVVIVTTLFCQSVFAQATTDEQNRLNHQNRIDDFALITDASFAATHNTFHAVNDGYGGIPNHVASRSEQLRAGIQIVNYDVYRHGGYAAMCHGACLGEADPLVEGLDDIYQNLLENPNKVIFLVFQLKASRADNVYPLIVGDFQSHPVGSFLYKPSNFNSSYASTGQCRPLPLNQISEADIKRQVNSSNGSALVVLNWHGDEPETPCATNNKTLWDYSWALKAKIADGNVHRGTDSWILQDENRGWFSQVEKRFSASEITIIMEHYGANLIGLDHIVDEAKGGDRFHSLIWSWAPSQPKLGDDNTKGCVVSGSAGWRVVNCAESHYAACQSIDSTLNNTNMGQSWRLTSSAVTATEAQNACQALGSNYHFAAPVNPQQAFHLRSYAPNRDLYINVRKDVEYADENGAPQYSVRVAGSHNGANPEYLLTAYQNNTLLQEVDSYQAAYDQAFIDYEGAYDAMVNADAEYDAAHAALIDCQDRRAINRDLCPWSEYKAAFDRYNAAYDASLAASEFYMTGAWDALGAARQAWADKRSEYQNRVATPPPVSEVNVALGKTAALSSEHGSGLYPASMAVNGVKNDFAHNGVIVAGQWWQVDLGSVHQLTRSNWYNRTNCCAERMNNYSIHGSLDGVNWFEINRQSTQMGEPTVIQLNTAARYVRLVQHNNEPLNFAEAEIFGVSVGDQVNLSNAVSAGQVKILQDSRTTWFPVAFDQAFDQAPIVLASPISQNDSDPSFAVVRNVSAQGFEIQLREWDYLDGSHAEVTIDYLAVLPGSHTVGGMQFDAASISVDEYFQTLSFTNRFSGVPAVFAQLQMGNLVYQSAVPRMMNVSNTSVQVSLYEQESHDRDHAFERVNVIAVSQGSATINGKRIHVGKITANHNNSNIAFTNNINAPLLFSSIETFNGGDTAAVRRMGLTPSHTVLKVEEEQSSDLEVSHANETLSWMVIER